MSITEGTVTMNKTDKETLVKFLIKQDYPEIESILKLYPDINKRFIDGKSIHELLKGNVKYEEIIRSRVDNMITGSITVDIHQLPVATIIGNYKIERLDDNTVHKVAINPFKIQIEDFIKTVDKNNKRKFVDTTTDYILKNYKTAKFSEVFIVETSKFIWEISTNWVCVSFNQTIVGEKPNSSASTYGKINGKEYFWLPLKTAWYIPYQTWYNNDEIRDVLKEKEEEILKYLSSNNNDDCVKYLNEFYIKFPEMKDMLYMFTTKLCIWYRSIASEYIYKCALDVKDLKLSDTSFTYCGNYLCWIPETKTSHECIGRWDNYKNQIYYNQQFDTKIIEELELKEIEKYLLENKEDSNLCLDYLKEHGKKYMNKEFKTEKFTYYSDGTQWFNSLNIQPVINKTLCFGVISDKKLIINFPHIQEKEVNNKYFYYYQSESITIADTETYNIYDKEHKEYILKQLDCGNPRFFML